MVVRTGDKGHFRSNLDMCVPVVAADEVAGGGKINGKLLDILLD